MSIWDNIECELCANHCDVLNFGSAEQSGTYTFKIKFNDNERLVKIDFTMGEEIVFPVENLNEDGVSYIAIYRPDNALIAVCKVHVSIDYTPQGEVNCPIPPFIPDCPNLCEVILGKDWEEIKECLNENQINEAIDDLCEVCPECEDVTYQILRDGEPYESGSEPSGGSIVVDVPSDCPECDPLEITLNGDAFLIVPSGTTQDIELVNQDDVAPAYSVTGNKITVTEPRILVLRNVYAATEDYIEYTITADEVGTLNSMTQDGGSGTISYLYNAAPVALPITTVIGGVLRINRTTSTNGGWVRLVGTYT